MDLAARRRAPIASITVALPVMMSPIITPQPPHMPVPSIMIGVQTDDRVDVFLAGHLGDRLHHPDWAAATNRSMPVPFCITWQSLSMIKPLSAQLPSSVGIMSKSLTARICGSNGQFFMARADGREDPIPGALKRRRHRLPPPRCRSLRSLTACRADQPRRESDRRFRASSAGAWFFAADSTSMLTGPRSGSELSIVTGMRSPSS